MAKRNNCILTSYRLSPAEPDRVPCGGTAVFIAHRNRVFLCTVRHTIDRGYVKQGHNFPLATTLSLSGFFKVDLTNLNVQTIRLENLVWVHDKDGHDLTVCEITTLAPFGNLVPIIFSTDQFAVRGTSWAEPRVDIGCSVFYSGYPDAIISHGDVSRPLVARQGILACDLREQIDVPDVIGKSYGLIDSYAQRGFSGAPLWSSVTLDGPMITVLDGASNVERTIALQIEPDHKLLGLICGHYRTADDRANGAHSGLSYFVKCDQIQRLLEHIL